MRGPQPEPRTNSPSHDLPSSRRSPSQLQDSHHITPFSSQCPHFHRSSLLNRSSLSQPTITPEGICLSSPDHFPYRHFQLHPTETGLDTTLSGRRTSSLPFPAHGWTRRPRSTSNQTRQLNNHSHLLNSNSQNNNPKLTPSASTVTRPPPNLPPEKKKKEQ